MARLTFIHMKRLNYIFILVAFIVFGCESGFKTNRLGLEYKFIVKTTNKAKPEKGDVLVLKFICTNEKDQLINASDIFKIRFGKLLGEGSIFCSTR